ncbi:transcriptional regulator, RpiR family [Natronincola peptidivorans]|uniref:Transcriptional regulator, RpiR family n=1 Tax=Natronincola peptidivorans TaxID=426128 RepID=A0A1I0ARJ3_9FIRM|nr:MurR/RpiR family transcriptional regulator [Natronincola peptidivorans]SES97013.1 transcriptional regulator, RpiR family [Natronincola peptidivorans]
MSCILKIREVYQELTPTEQKIANYVIEHGDQVSVLSAAELGELVKTSPPSIVRFARKLGYAGFQEMKLGLVKDAALQHKQQDKIYEAVSIHDSTKEIIYKIGKENMKAIEETMSVVDETEMAKAIDAMTKANHINIYGVAASGLVGLDLQYKLMRINKKSSMYMDSHTQLASAIHMGKGDVAVGISHSGRTLETYKAIETAKKRGATIISITKYGKNPISDLADINLFTASVEKNLRTGAIASRIAQLSIVDILFVGIARNNFNEVSKYIQATREIVEDFKV